MFWGKKKKSNTKKLKSAMMKSIMLAINEDGNSPFKEKLLKQRSIMMVEEEKRFPVKPEPGEPQEPFAQIQTSHNQDTGMTYINIEKGMFEYMEEEEIDELVYQIYDQADFSANGMYPISMIDIDGEVCEINVDSHAASYEAEGKDEPTPPKKDSCDSESSAEEGEKEAAKAEKSAKQKAGEDQQKTSAMMKAKHPKYATSNAKFNKEKVKHQGSRNFYTNDGTMEDVDIAEVHKVENILEYAIAGTSGGKSKSINPKKRLNMRAIISESSDKEYIAKKGIEGKNLEVTMLVDRSGSMNGSPTYESNVLIGALNNLAFKHPEFKVNIILSQTGSNWCIELPVDSLDSKELWKVKRTGSAEGLHDTMTAHFPVLKRSDVNLVYTDGSIQDNAIDKAYMESQEVELTGLYTNESFTPEDIMRHYEKNQKYFTHTIIRKDAEALVNELAQKLVISKNSK